MVLKITLCDFFVPRTDIFDLVEGFLCKRPPWGTQTCTFAGSRPGPDFFRAKTSRGPTSKAISPIGTFYSVLFMYFELPETMGTVVARLGTRRAAFWRIQPKRIKKSSIYLQTGYHLVSGSELLPEDDGLPLFTLLLGGTVILLRSGLTGGSQHGTT